MNADCNCNVVYEFLISIIGSSSMLELSMLSCVINVRNQLNASEKQSSAKTGVISDSNINSNESSTKAEKQLFGFVSIH